MHASPPATARRFPLVPHAGPVDGEQTAGASKTGTLRAAIFGVNDGLVSNAALIMGFAGADQPRAVILLAGIAGLLAGAFSMGAGEYVSMRVQREMLERILHLEAHELGSDPEGELAELAELYERKGVPADLARSLADRAVEGPGHRARHPRARGARHRPRRGARLALGRGLSSFVTFAIGASVPLLPFLFVGQSAGVRASAAITGLALLLRGRPDRPGDGPLARWRRAYACLPSAARPRP